MADETLMMLAKDVRAKTLRMLDGIDNAAARFTPAGLQNNIIWHGAHAYVVVEHLSVAPSTGQAPVVPEGWFEWFSWKGNPAAITTWPELSEVVERLGEQLRRLTGGLESMTLEKLNAPHGDPARGRTVRWSILHGLHDEAGHQGEMWLLRKLYGKQRG